MPGGERALPEILSSLQNPRVKRVVKLRQRRARDQQQAFLIEGYRELRRAVDSKLPLEEVFTCPELHLGENEVELLAEARESCGAQIQETSRAVFEKISYRDRPDGLLGVAPIPFWSLDQLPDASNPLYLVASAIEKPGNLGTILRCADAVGIDGVIVCDAVTDVFNPNVVRASVGTLFTVPVALAPSAAVREWLRARKVRCLATTPAATNDHTSADLTQPTALILGSEQYGLDEEWLSESELQVRIPMQGSADSLNVAMATTVVLFEAQRQRLAAQ